MARAGWRGADRLVRRPRKEPQLHARAEESRLFSCLYPQGARDEVLTVGAHG